MALIIGIVIFYMLGMLFIGYRAQRSVKGTSDFFTGGNRFGALMTAIAHQAAALSGWLFIAWPQQIAGSGLGAIWTAFSSGFAPFINFFVMARRTAKLTLMTKSRSIIDLLEARYYDEDKKILRLISSVIIAISITVYASSQLMAAGTTFQAVLGLDYRISVLIGAIVVILYTSAGGFLAVVWTDFIQGMLMIFAVVVGLIVALGKGGSPADVTAAVAAIDPAKTTPWINPVTIVGLLSAGWLGYMGQPQIVQMFMGMKDPKKARGGAVIAGCTGVFLLFATFFINLWCFTLYPNSAAPGTNFIQMIVDYTPRFLVGIVTAAILAAVMSSTDALLHVATTTISQDFFNKLLKKGKASDRQILLVARISAVVIGLFAVYIAYNPFDSLLWVNWYAWGALSVFAPVLILGYYWKRATREGAMAGMIVGFVAVYAWYKAGLNTTLHYTFIAFFVTLIVEVAVSLVTKAPPQRIRDMVEELGKD